MVSIVQYAINEVFATVNAFCPSAYGLIGNFFGFMVFLEIKKTHALESL